MTNAITLLFVVGLSVVSVLLIAYGLVLARRAWQAPASETEPAWVRFHARYYVFALLFIAFDMEMAYMYPWAVVFRSLGWFAFAEIGFFLTILGLGILYAWKERGLEWS